MDTIARTSPRTDQQLSCRAGGQHDRQQGTSRTDTGWGKVSKARAGKPFTRSMRVKANKIKLAEEKAKASESAA